VFHVVILLNYKIQFQMDRGSGILHHNERA